MRRPYAGETMKIVHVITRSILGGAQENTLYTVEGQQRAGHDVTLVTGPAVGPEGELLARAMRSGARIVVEPNLVRAVNPWRDARAYFRLKRMFRESRPDVVHTHSSKAGVLGRCAARRSGVPVVVHTIHGLPFFPYQSRLVNRFYVALERRCARITDRIISVADSMTAQALAAGVGAPEQFRTIYSGLEVETFLRNYDRASVRARFGLSEGDLVVGKVARLSDLKGHEFLFKAFERVAKEEPRAKLLLIGDGWRRTEYERQVRAMALAGRVVFAGLIPPSEVPAAIHAMDVLVHTSLHEGLARVLPQALISGVPVITYDIDGAREVVENDVTGILLPPKEIDGLSNAILRLLRDGALRSRLALAGRSRLTPLFDHRRMVELITATYVEALAGKTRVPTRRVEETATQSCRRRYGPRPIPRRGCMNVLGILRATGGLSASVSLLCPPEEHWQQAASGTRSGSQKRQCTPAADTS
jgi:glycosyltransferase involved in cell wall biosynthesis